MPVGYISDQTTDLSNLSLSGRLAVGGGTGITSILKGTVSIVTMTLGASSSATTSASVPGLSTSDLVVIAPPNTLSGLSSHVDIAAWVSAASTLIVRFSNTSTAQVVQAGPVSYLYTAFRS